MTATAPLQPDEVERDEVEPTLSDGRGVVWPPAKTMYALRGVHRARGRGTRRPHEDR